MKYMRQLHFFPELTLHSIHCGETSILTFTTLLLSKSFFPKKRNTIYSSEEHQACRLLLKSRIAALPIFFSGRSRNVSSKLELSCVCHLHAVQIMCKVSRTTYGFQNMKQSTPITYTIFKHL